MEQAANDSVDPEAQAADGNVEGDRAMESSLRRPISIKLN